MSLGFITCVFIKNTTSTDNTDVEEKVEGSDEEGGARRSKKGRKAGGNKATGRNQFLVFKGPTTNNYYTLKIDH